MNASNGTIGLRHFPILPSLSGCIILPLLVTCMKAERISLDAGGPEGLLLGGLTTGVIGENATGGRPQAPGTPAVPPSVYITGLMGTIDIILTGANGLMLEKVSSGADGTITFRLVMESGSTYEITAAQRATFAVNPTKRDWVSQNCTIIGGKGIASASTPTATVTCINTPTIYDPTNHLLWMRCTQGQVYNPTTNNCQGAGQSAPWGALTLKYCATIDDSCNDTGAETESGRSVSGHLNGRGASDIYASCADMNQGNGVYNMSNWRVPTLSVAELPNLLEAAAPYFDPLLFPDTISDNYYWASSTETTQMAWSIGFTVYNPVLGWYKTVPRYLRCVSNGQQ